MGIVWIILAKDHGTWKMGGKFVFIWILSFPFFQVFPPFPFCFRCYVSFFLLEKVLSISFNFFGVNKIQNTTFIHLVIVHFKYTAENSHSQNTPFLSVPLCP